MAGLHTREPGLRVGQPAPPTRQDLSAQGLPQPGAAREVKDALFMRTQAPVLMERWAPLHGGRAPTAMDVPTGSPVARRLSWVWPEPHAAWTVFPAWDLPGIPLGWPSWASALRDPGRWP